MLKLLKYDIAFYYLLHKIIHKIRQKNFFEFFRVFNQNVLYAPILKAFRCVLVPLKTTTEIDLTSVRDAEVACSNHVASINLEKCWNSLFIRISAFFFFVNKPPFSFTFYQFFFHLFIPDNSIPHIKFVQPWILYICLYTY